MSKDRFDWIAFSMMAVIVGSLAAILCALVAGSRGSTTVTTLIHASRDLEKNDSVIVDRLQFKGDITEQQMQDYIHIWATSHPAYRITALTQAVYGNGMTVEVILVAYRQAPERGKNETQVHSH